MKKSVIVSFSYIAAIIGAGFASGAEMVSYFLKYGKQSILGVLLASFLFGLLSYFVLEICVREKISSFEKFLGYIIPKKLAGITNFAVLIFMVLTLSAMSAAAGEIFNLLFDIDVFFAALIFSVICAIILMMSVEKITCINGVLGVIITAGIIIACLYIINFRFFEAVPTSLTMIFSSVTYTSYNIAAALVLLCGMSLMLENKKQAACVGVFSGVGIFLILACLWGVVGLYYGKVELGEIPMLTIARRQPFLFSAFYSIILFLAVLTTAVSNGFGVAEYLKRSLKKFWAVIITVILMFMLSFLGFGKIVDIGYRVCGWFLIIIPVYIIKKQVISRKTEKNKDKLI